MGESLSQAGTPSAQELEFVLRLCQPEIRGQGSGDISQESRDNSCGSGDVGPITHGLLGKAAQHVSGTSQKCHKGTSTRAWV